MRVDITCSIIVINCCHYQDITLQIAVEKGQVEVVEKLISSGADVNAVDEVCIMYIIFSMILSSQI